ncbi:MAG: co-chaperone GroES [Coriobacteriia bacterium]|jgi:chaperonin GroES|nr:co-chaperone GroES [Coriobacteriia bacterium]
MNLKPLGDRVIVKPAEAEEQTKSGLFIPDTAQEKPQRGEVVAIGDGKLKDDGTRVPIDVKVGDTVIYSKYGGSEVKIDGVEYKILDAERDIIAVVI